MRIYTISTNAAEHGECYAFTSRREAERKRRELLAEAQSDRAEQEDARMFVGREEVFPIAVQEFPISAKGIIMAYEAGAYDVPK